MRFEETTITPEMAKAFLSNNPRNRTISNKRLQKYCTDIKNGTWGTSPQPVCLGSEGKLIDGQHRLTAVLLTGIPIKSVIAYDVPDDAVIDRGKERRLGEALYMRGLIDKKMSSNQMVAIVNDYLTRNNVKRVSDDEKGKFIIEHTDQISRAYELSCLCMRKKQHICRRAPIQAAILGALLCGVDDKTLENFCRVANSGFMNSREESAAIVLRNAVLNAPEYAGGREYAGFLRKTAQMAIRDFANGTPRVRAYSNPTNVYLDK